MSEATSDTRTVLLDAAEALILDRGFAGATVDAMVDRAGVSKGAFFHHFSTKAELGRALAEREARRELERLERLLDRAEEVSADPLIQVLITVAVLEEEVAREGGEGTGPAERPAGAGSIRAALAAEGPSSREDLPDATAYRRRRELLARRLEAAARRHDSVGEVEPAVLAEMLEVILEGSRLVGGTSPETSPAAVLSRQLAAYREFLEVLYSLTPPDAGPG